MRNSGSMPTVSRAMMKKLASRTFASVVLTLLVTSLIMWVAGRTAAIPFALLIASLCVVTVSPFASFVFYRQTLELEATHKALEEAHQRLSEMHAKLKTAHRDLEHRASHDSMTGLANRDKFISRLSEYKRQAGSGYLLMIDADRFKRINDIHGHDTGDQALLAIGQAISGSIRATDVGARIGGEEFAVLLGGANSAEAAGIAERLRATVERMSLATEDGNQLKLTVSIGGAPFGPHSRTKDIMRAADKQLYEAKRNGRNQVLIAETAVQAA